MAIAIGESIHAARQGLTRNDADNQRWKEALKERSLQGLRAGLEATLPADTAIRLIETPYNTTKPGRGLGHNELSCHTWTRSPERHTVTALADIIDGSWNAACGVPWSASTMVALTDAQARPTPVEELVLADFKRAVIVPVASDPAGFFHGGVGEPPRFREVGRDLEYRLSATTIEDVRHTRLFMDLFTAETYEQLEVSIDAVKPLMYDWSDFARFYGAGIELMSLLGRPGTTPGFGGYVAANQKADNLIPTVMLLEGAGVVVTDWWGAPIDRMRIMDRKYVAIAANRRLHEHLVRHLSQVRVPG